VFWCGVFVSWWKHHTPRAHAARRAKGHCSASKRSSTSFSLVLDFGGHGPSHRRSSRAGQDARRQAFGGKILPASAFRGAMHRDLMPAE